MNTSATDVNQRVQFSLELFFCLRFICPDGPSVNFVHLLTRKQYTTIITALCIFNLRGRDEHLLLMLWKHSFWQTLPPLFIYPTVGVLPSFQLVIFYLSRGHFQLSCNPSFYKFSFSLLIHFVHGCVIGIM